MSYSGAFTLEVRYGIRIGAEIESEVGADYEFGVQGIERAWDKKIRLMR